MCVCLITSCAATHLSSLPRSSLVHLILLDNLDIQTNSKIAPHLIFTAIAFPTSPVGAASDSRIPNLRCSSSPEMLDSRCELPAEA